MPLFSDLTLAYSTQILLHCRPIARYVFHFLFRRNNFALSLSAVYFSPDHLPDSHSNIKFLQIPINTPFQDNYSYTQHHLHFKLIKTIALILYFTSMSQFKNYQSPNHSALEILLLNPQASHLGLPISHPTSIFECWCIFQPIAFTTRLCLISKLENSLPSTSVVSSL